MGKAGRVACIFTPYMLTIASLVCIIMVGLGCTQAHSSTLDNLYFFRFNLQHVTTSSATTQEVQKLLNEAHITSVSVSQVESVMSQLQSGANVKDFYSVGLWGYCDGDITNNHYDTSYCSQPKSEYYFNPLKVWHMDNAAVRDSLPSEYGKAMNIYKTVSKWMFIAYIIAFVATAAELLVGVFAICSRWGSCVTTLVSIVAFLFTTAASVTASVLFTALKGAVEASLKPYNIKGNIGPNMFAATWLAVVFSLGATLFWMFSTCCCSGRSPYNHRNRDNRDSIAAEKAPYTYEPLGPNTTTPYGSHSTAYPPPPVTHGNDIPMANMNTGTNAYEPYRHG